MHDRPTGVQLLAAARAVLIDELMPLLPAERRVDALLVGGCLAIAAREAAAGAAPAAAGTCALAGLYQPASPSPAPWRRFAGDLRLGAFENSPRQDKEARRILWRLTLAKLRLANPRFVAANGFAVARGVGG